MTGDDGHGDEGSSAGTTGNPSPLLTSEQVARIRSLIDTLQDELPAPYRSELFRQLLPTALGRESGRVARPGSPSVTQATPAGVLSVDSTRSQESTSVAPTRARVNLALYAPILGLPGRTLLKALVALEAAGNQLGIDWMSPSEIERFLVERARVPSVYRTNLSNALRGARQLVDRRRRGRGYEYRITSQGKTALDREVAMSGGG